MKRIQTKIEKENNLILANIANASLSPNRSSLNPKLQEYPMASAALKFDNHNTFTIQTSSHYSKSHFNKQQQHASKTLTL